MTPENGGGPVGGRDAVVRQVVVDVGRVAALRALFESDEGEPLVGAELPPLWHWAALPGWPRSSALGPDGHADEDGMRHPEGLPRRMFAGGTVRFHHPLIVGDPVTTRTWVQNLEHKSGRSGPFDLVEQRIEIIDGAGRLALEERKNIVYRPAVPQGARAEGGEAAGHQRAPQPPAGAPLLREGDGRWAFRTDPSLLMRFSAATANAHRIHYDHPYATLVEGYPGLVVHGPLMSIALAEVARRETDARVTGLTHRTVAPLFCGDDAVIELEGEGLPSRLQLRSGDSPRTVLDLTFDPSTESS